MTYIEEILLTARVTKENGVFVAVLAINPEFKAEGATLHEAVENLTNTVQEALRAA